ncbi:MAG: MFS transporter [Thermoplasmata archaeon]|nr:MFS transporter [Thermoplasmata archaeon]MCI4359414.1 MFS transporter [Thermoplasmata archaeon]
MDIKTPAPIRPSTSDLWFFSYLPLAISDGIATPLIPLLALQEFGASAFVVTIIVAASAMSQVPFTILWGNLSDRVAHRKFFLVGSFLATGVSIVLIAAASTLMSYFWLNVVEGLASAASAPIGTMLLLETRQKRWWPQDIGMFGLISGVGSTVGLAIGILWLFVVGLHQPVVETMRGLLVLSGALSLLAAGIAWVWIEEPAVRLERRSLADLVNLHRGVIERVRHFRSRVLNIVDLTRGGPERIPRREVLFLAALGVMCVGFDMFYGPFPVFLWQTARFSDAGVFIAYLAASAASSALFYHSGLAVEIHSPKNVFLESLGARVVLLLLFLWGPAYVLFGLGSPALLGWVSVLNALMGVSWAFVSTASTLFLVRLVGRTNRGRALGLYNAIGGAGGLLGTLLGGWMFVTFGVTFAYDVAALTIGLGAVLLLPIPYHMFLVPHTARARRPTRAPERVPVAFDTLPKIPR